MKKSSPLDEVIAGSACGPLAAKVVAAQSFWTAFEKAIKSCFHECGSPPTFILDPFELLPVIVDMRGEIPAGSGIEDELLRETEHRVRELVQIATRDFDLVLRKYFSTAGIECSGRYPKYQIEGFLNIVVEAERALTRIGATKIKTVLAARVAFEAIAEVEKERARQLPPEQFLSECGLAYREVVRLQMQEPGSPIGIRDLYKQIVLARRAGTTEPSAKAGARSLTYSEEFFKRDLARLISNGNYSLASGEKMELFPTAFLKEAIPIPTPEGIRYIGKVAIGGSSP